MTLKEFFALLLIAALGVAICYFTIVRYSDRICTHPMTPEYRKELRC